MKANLPKPSHLSLALAAAVSIAGVRAQSAVSAAASSGSSIQMPTYEVTEPKFTSTIQEFYEKIDNLTDTTWVDAQGGPLIQAIIWRYGYLRVHPSDEAIIYVARRPNGAVAAATTIYTEGGKLYANSYALGDHARLNPLMATDIHDSAKIEHVVDGIREQYELGASLMLAEVRGGNHSFAPVMGYFTNNPFVLGSDSRSPWNEDTGQIVPSNANIFYTSGGVATVSRSGFSNYPYDVGMGDRFHESPPEMLDTVYRALHNPDQAGLIPVAISPIDARVRTGKGLEIKPRPAIVFDWEGVHYVYRPYVGTIGHSIPSNPVTGLPYLCVRDSGLMESIYFTATYLKSHPGEKAVVVPSDDPSVAYTEKGRLWLFSPSLNHFALLSKTDPGTINDEAALKSSISRIKDVLATLPVPPGGDGRQHLKHVPEELVGDTADLQMRRVFVAFQNAGIPVHLKSGESSNLNFTWLGVNYFYGPDQQLRLASND
jgi:hypothetical protein